MYKILSPLQNVNTKLKASTQGKFPGWLKWPAWIKLPAWLKTKWAVRILIVLVLGGAGFFAYRTYQQTQAAKTTLASLQTTQVTKGNLKTTIDASGNVRPVQSVVLTWQTTGTVEKVNVVTGQAVKDGDILATLADSSLPQEVIDAQADLETAKEALETLYTTAETNKTTAMNNIATYAQSVRDAQYDLDNFIAAAKTKDMTAMEALRVMEEKLKAARDAFEPHKFDYYESTLRQDLKEALDLAQSNYDNAVNRVEYEYVLSVAKANLANAQAQYEKYENGPTEGELATANANITSAEAMLKEAYLEAPIDGTVVLVRPQVGDQISENEEGFEIDNLTAMYIDVSVSEVDVNQVKNGQEATISFDAIRNKTYKGEVTDVSMVGSDSNYTVTIKVTDADAQVLTGMTATVEIVSKSSEATLLVPTESIRTESSAQYVYVMAPGTGLTKVKVTVGASSDSMTQILSGELAEGDIVVVNPTTDTATAANKGMGGFMMLGGGGPPPDGGGPQNNLSSNNSSSSNGSKP